MSESAKRVRVLFLCTGASCRSQMAAGWARALALKREREREGRPLIEAHAAGVRPQGLNPLAVRAMAEAGVDISGAPSQSIEALGDIAFDYVITVCDHARESCPVFNGSTRIIHAGFDDPPRLAQGATSEDEAMPHYRRVRDEIRDFVERFEFD